MQNKAIEPGYNEDNPVTKQIFKPSSWLTKIDYINHLVLFNNVMIAILGEQGAGKTTFIDLLQSRLDSNIRSHVMRAIAPFSQDDLLAQLDAVFHLRADTKLSLASLVNQINERKSHILMIIDDAQHLPDSFLQEVLHELKSQGDHGYFHLCLVSDFSLVTSLNQFETSQIHSLELGVLTKSETKTYLLNSLPASAKLEKAMTDKRLEQFYQLTGGNIARINNQMRNYFCAKAASPTEKRKSFIKGISILAFTGAVLMASSYIWQNQFLPSSAREFIEQDLIQPVAEIMQPLPSLVPVITTPEKIPVLVSELPDINEQLARQPSKIPSWVEAAVRQQVQPSPKRIVDVVLEDENDDSLVVRDRVVVIPKTLNVQPAAPIKKLTTSSPVIPTKVGQAQLAQAKVATNNATKQQFTIQLMASRSRVDIMSFVKTHPIKLGTKIRLTKRDGLDWYVLTLGEFGQVQDAQNAMKNLPMDLAKFKPWIRPVAQLKAFG